MRERMSGRVRGESERENEWEGESGGSREREDGEVEKE